MSDKELGQLSAVVRIVDDEETVRKSVAFVLRLIGLDVRLYESAEQFLEFDDSQRPGCVVLDIRMPGMSGLQLQTHLKVLKTELPIIFLTAHGSIEDAVKTIKKGACDFLTKPVKDEVLIDAIESAVELCLQEVDAKLQAQQETGRLRQLTEREMQIALALSEGKLNKTIAFDLGISERTVQVHRANILRKLNIRSMAELATMLVHAGMR